MRTLEQIKQEIESEDFQWFGRDKFIERICEHILKDDESKHICLKGVWGSGKTTTILGMQKYLENKETLVLYLDAWKYENYEHPTYALLKAIKDSKEEVYNDIKERMEEKKLTFQVGVNLPFLSNIEFSATHEHHGYKIISEAEYMEEFNQVLIDAIQEYKKEESNKLVIFVDELDRANPAFALKTLETFHHLYDDLPTHFVYSVDLDQLNSMIKHYYGYEYNTEIFVHKVFDEIIELEPLSTNEMSNFLARNIDVGQYNSDKIMSLILLHVDSNYKNSLRSMNYVLKLVNENINKGYFVPDDYFLGFDAYYLGDDRKLLWGYVELMIILISQSLSDPLLVRNFLEGRDLEQLTSYIIERNEEGILLSLIFESYIREESINENQQEIKEKLMKEKDPNKIKRGLHKLFTSNGGYGSKSVFSEFIL